MNVTNLRRRLTDLRKRVPAILIALAVGIPAGYLFDVLDTPIPWMIGPMIAVAALNLSGLRTDSPPFARQMGQVLLGSAVGLYFTPSVVTALAANWMPIVVATLAAFLIGGLGAVILSRVSGVDARSTFRRSLGMTDRMPIVLKVVLVYRPESKNLNSAMLSYVAGARHSSAFPKL